MRHWRRFTQTRFGDAGKGVTVDYLCERTAPARRPLVVRFSGGHQAGHTVVLGGFSHTFSSYCAGSLRGVPGYFGPGTVIFPPAIRAEWRAIEGYHPTLVVHPLASVCVPYDIAWNRAQESLRHHGSCGVGYGAVVERVRDGIVLAAKDLDCAWMSTEKLKGIGVYYEGRLARERDRHVEEVYRKELGGLTDSAFIEACGQARPLFRIAGLREMRSAHDFVILEGSQGILLDAVDGAFPHLSWSSATSHSALEILSGLLPRRIDAVDLYDLTRCYQTRHGCGPMSSSSAVCLVNAEAEANVEGPWQGPFRIAALDPALLAHALRTDAARLETGLAAIESRCETP